MAHAASGLPLLPATVLLTTEGQAVPGLGGAEVSPAVAAALATAAAWRQLTGTLPASILGYPGAAVGLLLAVVAADCAAGMPASPACSTHWQWAGRRVSGWVKANGTLPPVLCLILFQIRRMPVLP
jgi:hypothetical protein